MKGVPADSTIQLEEVDSLDVVLSFVAEKEEDAIVVVPLADISSLKQYNSVKKNPLIKIVALCQDSETEKLAEHQKKNRGADMYLPAPLTADYLSLVEEVFSISDVTAEKSTSTFAEDPSIKFDLSSIEDELKDHKIEDIDSSDDETDISLDHDDSSSSANLAEDETRPNLEEENTLGSDDLFESSVDDILTTEQETDQDILEDELEEEDPNELGQNTEENNLLEAKVSNDKNEELEGLSFETEEDLLEDSEQEQELEFEGAPEESADSESLCFEVSDEESSLGTSMEDDDDIGVGDLDDELEFDSSDSLEASDPDEDALNDLVSKEVSDSEGDSAEGELDLSGDSEGELDLSGDSEGELDLSGDSDGELDLSGDSEGELDLSGDSEGELDLSGDSDGELDLSGDSDGELSLSGDNEGELDLSGDSDGELDLSSTGERPGGEEVERESDLSDDGELDFTAGDLEDESEESPDEEGQLPSQEDLDFPDMPGASMAESSENLRATDDSTGDIDTTLVDTNVTPDSQTEPENAEFDYKTSMNNEVLSAATKTKPTPAQTVTVGDENLSEFKAETEAPERISPRGDFSSKDLDKIYHQFEVMKAQRDELVKELERERSHLRKSETEVIQLREEVEELKVENKILKKRHERKGGDYQRQYDVSEEKRRVLEEKLRVLKNKYDESVAERQSINSSNRSAEKSLESKIELMEIDHRSQITSREEKINELRRGNEALEFNLETLTIKNQELLEKKKEIEERLRLVISSLRGSIDLIEEDQSVLIEEIKLNEEMDDQ